MDRIFFLRIVCVFILYLTVESGDNPVEVIKGELKRDCVTPRGSESCTKKMDLTRKSNMKKSDYNLSDDESAVPTAKAWNAVMRNKVYTGKPGQEVRIIITAKRGQIFEIKSLTFLTQNSEKVVIESYIVYSGTSRSKLGEEKQVQISKSGEFTEVTGFKANATSIQIIFVLDKKKTSEGIRIKQLQLKACKQESEVKKEDKPTKFDKTYTRTPNRCLNLFSSNENKQFFIFDDNDPKRDENIIFGSSKDSPWYIGASGKDIELTITTQDGEDFEWWKICMLTSMAREVQFNLFASDVTYQQTKAACDCKSTTLICFSPWDRDITVRKGVVLIKPCKNSNSPAQVRKVSISGCRDHWHNNFVLHTNPGDYRILRINTVRNETLTLYGEKDNCGNMKKSEVLHYTDHTGNIGDNITVSFGQDSLVSKIINTQDTISFKWILNRNMVIINILTAGGKFQSDIRLDLENQLVIDVDLAADTKRRRKRRATCQNKQVHLNVIVKQCKAFKPGALVFAYVTPLNKKSSPIKVLARESTRSGQYDIILPKAEAAQNVIRKQCDSVIEVQRDECKRLSFITRERYRFICKQVRFMLDKFTSIKSKGLVTRARLHEICDMAFLATNTLCRATSEPPGPDRQPFLAAACNSGKNIEEFDFYKQLGNRIETSFFFRSATGKVFGGEERREIVLDKIPFLLVTLTANELTMEVFSVPEAPSIVDGYQMSIHYNCLPEDATTIELALVTNSFGRVKLNSCETKPDSTASICSCCDKIINGTSVKQLQTFDGQKLMDNFKIQYFKKNSAFAEVDYFVQVQ